MAGAARPSAGLTALAAAVLLGACGAHHTAAPRDPAAVPIGPGPRFRPPSLGAKAAAGRPIDGLRCRTEPGAQTFFASLGAGPGAGRELAATVGLAACVVLVAGFYRLGVIGMRTVGGEHGPADLAGRFAHTLIPIAFAYALAHYFSLLVFQGQAMGYLVSDPLGRGANLFGTAHTAIDYGVISSAGIWYVQVGALICGHVAGLVLAHDRALAIYDRVHEATRSQYWMLVVMVGFTSLGLWLLSAVNG